MTDLIAQYNRKLLAKYLPHARAGVRKFDFLGGRRSGKSYLIEQLLLGRALRGEVVSVATMTSEQGRLGSYADVCDIIAGSPTIQPYVKVLRTPRQIECLNGGRMFFNSYQDPERAKGIACDWLYINEANNFTERQYIDLSASVRRGIFADRNPNTDCWTERNDFTLIHSTWKDNEYLTEGQREWFEMLRRKAESPDATPIDIALYRMYYLGVYAEVIGTIFTPQNIQTIEELPSNIHSWLVFIDPSSLCGGDYFATVLCATDGAKMYAVDYWSKNDGALTAQIEVIEKIRGWQRTVDLHRVYIETNGLGKLVYSDFQNCGIPVEGWLSRGEKTERIMSNYIGITEQVVFVGQDKWQPFLSQVYTFGKGCEHDDNIDAINSALLAYKLNDEIKSSWVI